MSENDTQKILDPVLHGFKLEANKQNPGLKIKILKLFGISVAKNSQA